MDETKTIHKTCVRVNSADDDESRDEVDHDLPKKNPFVRGSDPRVATCRGRLQTRRCQLNQEINKELRLRAGAENLFKATTNRKLRETVALELSFVNSNLQLLKEQLAELNSSVELYQSDSKECVMPMIPLGLKETKEVDFREPFKDFIMEHYSEDPATYEDAISDFMDMRQAMRTPVRSTAGVALLFKYYNQLYYIERRFFPPDRSLGVYFEWFDSLTGVPSCQRTVAFEKACVLFNMAGIYTQIGAKQDRNTCAGLDGAVDALLRAAGTLRYIHENFTNAPSVDLAADTLLVLGALMTAQARECLFEKLQLQAREACGRERELRDDLDMCLDLAQESAQLAHTYTQLYEKMQSEGVFNYVPYSWVSLVHVKTEYYKALAHQYCATGLLNAPSGVRARERLAALYSPGGDRNVDNGSANPPSLKDQELDYMALGRAHLVEALALYEEALRLQRMCRELRGKEALSRAVRAALERAAAARALDGREPDFAELIDAPHILPSSKFQLALTPPDFAQHRVDELFRPLGPIAVFSAKRHWSAPRLLQLQKQDRRGSRRIRNGRDEYTEDKSRKSEKRDRSEDNSTYYNQIIRSDEKYTEEYDKKKLHRVMKQNGVYINSYNNNNNYEYHPKVLDYESNSYRNKVNDTFVKENGVKNGDVNGKPTKNGRERRKGDLRRVASEYNVSNSKTDDEGFGFSVRGDAPVVIAAVEPNSLADIGGMREGDFIISIGEKDVKWSSHEEVVRLIQQAGDTLTMRLATPMDKSLLKASPETPRQSNSNQGSVSAASTASSGSTAVTARSSARRAPSWNPFRRHTARDNSSHRGSHTSNVIFR
ncbi:rhophilin-2 isoform X1 [Ostrinia furnacalis]|uniref:rhophilin-2 isoform X1 n=1 Tax=Ostrinia furnacalis TaxID=93504 RepID=UPI00103FB7B5|nr:rhophilin-2 isoform X1 [Ostrinia furnacalis]